jgi:radical SAM superfamily enzyme YgiQ (UPF0313 family)/SAM-dependent methyltransferase
MNILLVNPNYHSESFGRYERVPAGLGFIARAVELNGFKCGVLDLNFSGIKDAFDIIGRSRPEYLGVSMMSCCVEGTYGFLEKIKSAFPSIKVMIGGPHVIAAGKDLFAECSAVDIACAGEGEEMIVELLRGGPLEKIKGILYRRAGEVVENAKREFSKSIDHLAFPVYNGFRLEKYSKCMPLASSRGCPYKCSFCGASRFLGTAWRKRSAEGMFEEFKYWHDKGYREFVFEDSLFSADRKRITDFCDLVVRSGRAARFSAEGVRADHLNREVLERMKRAGFESVTFGVESAADHVLKAFNKGETIERIEETVSIADELGFAIGLFFILGGPGETVADARKSFEFARRFENVADAYFFKLTPIPGTSYFDYALKRGMVNKNDRYPGKNFGFETTAAFGNDRMSAAELTGLLKDARNLEKKISARYSVRRYLTSIPGIKKIARPLMALYDFIDSLVPLGRILKKIRSAAREFKNRWRNDRGVVYKNKINSNSIVAAVERSGVKAAGLEYVACDLCGSGKYRIRYRKPDTWLWHDRFEYPVVECLDCSLVYVNPRPREDRMRLFYPSSYHAGRATSEHLKRYEIQASFLPDLKSEKILDIGCAQGDFLIFLKNNFPDILAYGVDLYADNIKSGAFEFYKNDLRECNFGGEEFDIITAWAVFEHLHYPSKYFEEVSRILKKKGKFVFLVTNSESCYGRYAFCEDVPRHTYHYSEKNLRLYADKYGFKFNKCVYNDEIFDGRGSGTFYHMLSGAAGVSWRDRYLNRIGTLQKPLIWAGKLLDKIVFKFHWETYLGCSGIMVAEFEKL